MIRAIFKTAPEKGVVGIEISGHAGYSSSAKDNLSTAVNSALLLTVNGITEILEVPAKADVEENKVAFWLPLDCPQAARDFLAALWLHLSYLSEDYPKTIHLTKMEV